MNDDLIAAIDAVAHGLQTECRLRYGSAWDIEIWKDFAWVALDRLRPVLKEEYPVMMDEALNDHADAS